MKDNDEAITIALIFCLAVAALGLAFGSETKNEREFRRSVSPPAGHVLTLR